MHRSETRKVKIGNLTLGGSNEVLIQSMCSTKTSNIRDVISQINEAARLGAKLMRVSILDEADALAIKEIKKSINVPLIADIHFDPDLAIFAIKNGVDKIRLNPGNLKSVQGLEKIIECAKKHKVAIRVGVNSGSLDEEILSKFNNKVTAEGLVMSAQKMVSFLEERGFYDIVISLKGSDVIETIKAYELASEIFPYPLHVGVTEAGIKDVGLIRSSAALAPLLLKGIGNTIRISLTEDPKEEVIAAKRLLKDLKLDDDFPTFISCPTCGRTEVDLLPLANKVNEFLTTNKINLTVAIMGCIVNGPGEAKHADIGVAGGKGKYVLFKKGERVALYNEEDVYDALIKGIKELSKSKK